MKPRNRCLALLVALQAAGCGHHPRKASITEEQTLDLGGVRRVEVETRNGRVDVQCLEEAAAFRLTATRSARGATDEDARAAAESITVEAARDPGQPDIFRVIARFPPEISGRSPGADLVLQVPAVAGLDVRTSNGAISVEGARAPVSLETSNGRIRAKDIRGNVTARTSNGAITASRVHGDLDLESSNGAIELEDVEAGSIAATTSNGPIKARRVAGHATLQTGNGPITIEAASLPANPRLVATTSNAPVSVTIPATARASLSLATSNASIEKDLGSAAVADLEATPRAVKAVLNGGGGEIRIATSNGKITFRAEP